MKRQVSRALPGEPVWVYTGLAAQGSVGCHQTLRCAVHKINYLFLFGNVSILPERQFLFPQPVSSVREAENLPDLLHICYTQCPEPKAERDNDGGAGALRAPKSCLDIGPQGYSDCLVGTRIAPFS